MKFRPRVKTDGQSLVEVVVALGVVVALAISLVTASLLTQRTSRTATNNTQATKLVEESIEQMRVFRDRKGFSALPSGAAGNTTYWCLNTTNADPATWTINSSPAVTCPETKPLNQTSFMRSINIADGANVNQKKVTVTVTWTDSSGVQTVQNDTVLSNCVSSTTSC